MDSICEPSDLGQGRTNSRVPVKVVAIIKYRVAKTESDCICVHMYEVICMSVCACVSGCTYIHEGHLCEYVVTCRPRTTTL